MEQYNVTGMSCAACSSRVEKAVSRVPGVTSCSVSLLTNSMGVEGNASSHDIIQAVEQAGYGASLKGAGKEQVSNSAPVDFGTLTADLGTVAYWGIYDALTAGNLLWYGSFTRSKNVLNGDAITVSAGAIVCTLA